MSLNTTTSSSYWDYLFTELADPRTNHWPLIASPVPGLTIIASYLYFVLNFGPKYMANRKPFQMQRTLVVYNFAQVLISVYLFVEGLDGAWLRHYSWRCQPVDWSDTPPAIRVAQGCYLYFLAKLTELLDTVFFTLRKKDNQISFLHLYHHTVMPMISWGATKYYPGGHGTFIGVINSFVHIVMYTYYMMAAMGPQFHKYLWWKKYITDLQMVQFGMAFMHSAQLLWTDCGYPRWSVCFTLPNAIFFYMLFNDFYKKTYVSKRRLADAKKKAESSRMLQEENSESKAKEQ
ncbi:elongation of very long chain fatty acids protein AAEL008004 [Uranotaenia lowii]|uniref:elongation of very long chain fatty acids protein AAEL008004 n=1 Tax=Uranotaenia lowii TaxID=190385 RepID=UPI00247AFB73|nr:elongation of very long chain fatty acids protein AAEL008004 [Uranotaenia lowii]XP_055597862.1 elongation of very long chain fatty acids protein AAEL008004 [Uranotaenia lowii]XP_055597863.1 elongation of very long chain fatty acids protein AAEL008004 [Uranotaenia lowii]XP_055597864.1 elongation of very long chain fatty acids protein AAEL008004 [Uranotaenia lowii]